MSGELVPPDRWQRIKAAFDQALQVPTDEREAAVAAVTTDPEIRREALALLAIHSQAGDFLEPPQVRRLAAGHRLGPYEIVEHLGSGGMGDVYRAHDTRLTRDVAVKVLRRRMADPATRARFLREARAIAALSHPNVLAIFDVGEEGGLPYLVTEMLTGETLRVRLGRDPLSVAQALAWTRQVAGGLAAAHERGIVHRDLKPENINVAPDGQLTILDFGLARSAARQLDDTVSMPGVVMGTAGYLAPEQARGLAVTPAGDLFSLGAILFEMLTGKRAFAGATASDTLSAVLEREPPAPSSLRSEVPAWLDRVVARCLAKEVTDRFQSARDLSFALQLPDGGARHPRAADVAKAPARRRWPLVVGGALAGAAVAAAVAAVVVTRASRSTGAPPVAAATSPIAAEPPHSVPITYSGRDLAPTVSPDGRFLAFVSERQGRPQIWLQHVGVGREKALTDGPDAAPRFSPDGNEILFTRDEGDGDSIYRIDLLGGALRKVIDDGSDADWSPDGTRIAFLRFARAGGIVHPTLMVVGVDGAGLRPVARLPDRPERARRLGQYVRWSPDGSRIAVTGLVAQPGMPQHVELYPVDGGPPTTVVPPARVGLLSAVAWDGPDTVIYSQALSVTGNSAGSAARIVRHSLDDNRIQTLLWTPHASTVVERWPGHGLVYDARSARQNLREVSRGGGHPRYLSRGTATDRQPCISPDGMKVVFSSNRGAGNLDLWILDRSTGASQRIAEHPRDDWDPAFTPDGNSILWSSNRGGTFEIWIANADGTNPRQITHDGDAENPNLTPDGQWIIYGSGATGRRGVWKIRVDGSDARRLVPDVVIPDVSPDGTYVLFQTIRSSKEAVVGVARVDDGTVLPFEIHIPVYQLNTSLLGRARWLPDGRSIAFVGQDAAGRTGIFTQTFDPDRDTFATRAPLAGFDDELLTESFDVGAHHVILAEAEQRSDVMAVTNLP